VKLRIYGIKTCTSVKKAIKFLKDNNIDFEFTDFKATPVNEEKIKEWIKQVDIKVLFNTKGKKYRDLKLKELNLSDEDKIKWMAKENLLIKRPVIEYKDKVLIGLDLETYEREFK